MLEYHSRFHHFVCPFVICVCVCMLKVLVQMMSGIYHQAFYMVLSAVAVSRIQIYRCLD